jgi:NTP pyrophosphatase (non-canonical NTP hydrolase)
MKTYAEMLIEWRDATGGDTLSLEAWAELRKDLLTEECRELCEAIDFYVSTGDARPMAKESADVGYVVWGAAQRPGIDVDAAFREVHRSNMTKFGPNGELLVREDGKILKGPNYEEADMSVAVGHGVFPPEPRVYQVLDRIEATIRSVPIVTRLLLIAMFAGSIGWAYYALIFTIARGK